MKWTNLGKYMGFNKSLGRSWRRKGMELPNDSFKPRIEMMGSHRLDLEYFRDLRGSANGRQ